MRKKTEPTVTVSKIKAIIEAEYAPLIDLFKSDEETRYYLNGFFIERHPVKGVCLVATNGHILGAFYHEDGWIGDEPLIVKLNKAMLQACQSDSKDRYGKKYLVIDGTDAKIIKATDVEHAMNGGTEMLMTQGKVLIDGSFPDWRRVIPHDYSRSTLTPAINATLLRPFETVSAAAGLRHNGKAIAPISIKSSMLAGACLVTTSRRDFFGVLMPMREATLETATTPAWARQTEADKLNDTPMEAAYKGEEPEVYGPPMPDMLNPTEPDKANDDDVVTEAAS